MQVMRACRHLVVDKTPDTVLVVTVLAYIVGVFLRGRARVRARARCQRENGRDHWIKPTVPELAEDTNPVQSMRATLGDAAQHDIVSNFIVDDPSS